MHPFGGIGRQGRGGSALTQCEPKPEDRWGGTSYDDVKRHDHKSIMKLLKETKKENKNV